MLYGSHRARWEAVWKEQWQCLPLSVLYGFHVCWCLACSTIPEGKWGTTHYSQSTQRMKEELLRMPSAPVRFCAPGCFFLGFCLTPYLSSFNCLLCRLNIYCGGVCGWVVNTSNSRSRGPGFKHPPSCCFHRQGNSLHSVTHGVTLRWTSISSRGE